MNFRHLLLACLIALPAYAGFDGGMEALEREDYNNAVAEFETAAMQGNLESAHQLGLMYLEGKGVAQDSAKAAEYFREAGGRWVVRDRHKLGYADAQYELGTMYRDGTGVAADADDALEWLRRAAEQGHPRAQLALGEMYLLDLRVSTDYAEAYFWLSLARDSLFDEDARKAEELLQDVRARLSREERRDVREQVSTWLPRRW